jgi:hypothetical protein
MQPDTLVELVVALIKQGDFGKVKKKKKKRTITRTEYGPEYARNTAQKNFGGTFRGIPNGSKAIIYIL